MNEITKRLIAAASVLGYFVLFIALIPIFALGALSSLLAFIFGDPYPLED